MNAEKKHGHIVKEMKEIILISTFKVKDSCHQETHQDKIIKRNIYSRIVANTADE